MAPGLEDRSQAQWLERNFIVLLTLGIVINATGLFGTVMEPDGALYASIAKTMAQNGDFINLYFHGNDWLDKPHFPFWIAACSMKVFGVNTFAYKFPAFLFWLLGLRYTYLFAKATYNVHIAQLASLIYITAAHLFISNNDVRAEPYLTGLIIASVYHFYQAGLQKKLSYHLFIGALLAAYAVMTKGIFVLITIGSGFLAEWFINGNWVEIKKPRWWLALFMIFLFIIPELVCLYLQFDLHPEKNVFNKTGVSGIRFFFWDSQFGRFFNTGPIKGEGNYFFYLHTMLWAFLPWTLLLLLSIFRRIRKFNNRQVNPEYISLGTVITSLLIFSASSFQLPHYLNILFPFFSILASQYLLTVWNPSTLKILAGIQSGMALLLFVSFIFLIGIIGNAAHLLVGGWIVLLSIWAVGLMGKPLVSKIIILGFFPALLVFGGLNLFFYPAMLKYQAGSEAARYINWNCPGSQAGTYQLDSYSFDFYIKSQTKAYKYSELVSIKQPVLLFTSKKNGYGTEFKALHAIVLKEFSFFHISKMDFRFINPITRNTTLDTMVIVRLPGQGL